jgi:hypothetical protein
MIRERSQIGSENRRLKAERRAEVCLYLHKVGTWEGVFHKSGICHFAIYTVRAVARKCTISDPCQYSS